MNNLIIVLLIITLSSCGGNDLKLKKAAGTYCTDFSYSYDQFDSLEQQKFLNSTLELNYDGTFIFSDTLSQEDNAGAWRRHDDELSGMIMLRYNNGAYAEISQCGKPDCVVFVTIKSNGELKKLPMLKCINTFDDIFD